MRVNGEKIKILVVDDIEVNRIILQEILSDTYEIEHAVNGVDALAKLYGCDVKPKLVLLDIMMPDMNGFEVIAMMKADSTLNKIPVIFITAVDEEVKGLNAGAMDFISKPFEPEIVRLRVANQIELNLYREKLEGLVQQKADELVSVKEHFLETMADLIEYRSLESGQHVKRTRELARMLVNKLLHEERYYQELVGIDHNMLVRAVPLHDIGKIGIPDNVLLKPGKLTPDEFKIIETHTVIGGNVIKSMMRDNEDIYLNHCYDICRHHHERWNGKGYPDGLAENSIPLSARIMSIIDVYDALVSERCYKKAFTHDEAVEIIREGAGTQFDPVIAESMLNSHLEFKDLHSHIKE